MKRNRFVVDKVGEVISLGTKITKLEEGETAFASLQRAMDACLARNPAAKKVKAVVVLNKAARRKEYFFRMKGNPQAKGKPIDLVITPAEETYSGYRSVFGRDSFLIQEESD